MTKYQVIHEVRKTDDTMLHDVEYMYCNIDGYKLHDEIAAVYDYDATEPNMDCHWTKLAASIVRQAIVVGIDPFALDLYDDEKIRVEYGTGLTRRPTDRGERVDYMRVVQHVDEVQSKFIPAGVGHPAYTIAAVPAYDEETYEELPQSVGTTLSRYLHLRDYFIGHFARRDYDADSRLVTSFRFDFPSVDERVEISNADRVFSAKVRHVRTGESKVFAKWAEHDGVNETQMVRALQWLHDDPLDGDGRMTREIGCKGGKLHHLKRAYNSDGSFCAMYDEDGQLWDRSYPSINYRNRI